MAKQTAAHRKVLPKRGGPRVSLVLTEHELVVRIPLAKLDRLRQARTLKVLGDMGYGGDER